MKVSTGSFLVVSGLILALASGEMYKADAQASGTTSTFTPGMVGVPVIERTEITTEWFGVPLPGGISDPDKSLLRSSAEAFGAHPPRLLLEDPHGALRTEQLIEDVSRIISFSRASRESGEFLWGRISGLAALTNTQLWVESRFKHAGLRDVRIEHFDAQRVRWTPNAAEVRLVGKSEFGEGTEDLVLKSAFPVSGAPPHVEVAAPLVFVGRGTDAELANVDLNGKIAVLNVPTGSVVGAKELGAPRRFVERGAVGVLTTVESPGNLQFTDPRYGCGDLPCFILGGDDGAFLHSILNKASVIGEVIEARLSVDSANVAGLIAENVVGILPGLTEEIIVINAHADGYFDGANDNADGLAVLLAMAEYYAKSEKPRQRTIVFLSSAGHHGPGNGPLAFVEAHPDIVERTVMVVNLEHVAQIDVPQRSRLDPAVDNYASSVWYGSTGERVLTAGAVNTTPQVAQLLKSASWDFGLMTYTIVNPSVPGDVGVFAQRGIPAVQLIAAQVFYHSSGDTISTISPAGLTRAAHFFVSLLQELDAMPTEQLRPKTN